MFRQLKKNLVATLIAAMTIGQVAPAFADSADTLPDMGTSAGSTLSIGQEMQMGDYYVRQLRGSAGWPFQQIGQHNSHQQRSKQATKEKDNAKSGN